LPLLTGAATLRSRQADSLDANKPDDMLRILIVDDNVDAANTIAMLLSEYGHHVSTEHDAQSAIDRAGREHPQALLLDIGLPDMDGYELARRMRAMPETARALYIALTGYGQSKDREQSTDAGFDHHLVKPVDMLALSRLLAHADARSP
jgi:CheY-like chemotaxis protein